MNDQAKTTLDAASVANGVAAFLGWLPDVAALLTVVWLAIRIYETRTVQRLLGREP